MIQNIRAVADGAEAEISLEISGAEGKFQQIKGKIASFMFHDLGLPSHLTGAMEISRERCESLIYSMQKTSAIKKGIVFLEYAKNNKKTLKTKLMRKGFPKEIAEDAVNYLAEKGYIREENDALQYAETLALRKYYGKNRIKKELFAKGYGSDIISDTMEELDVNFAEICAKRLAAMGGFDVFSDPEMKKKNTAALLRYGFSYEDIREAMVILQEDDE